MRVRVVRNYFYCVLFQMKDAQVMRDLTHRFKKEHAEYEAELQALKVDN